MSQPDKTIGPRSTAGEIADRLADLSLGFFGSAQPTDQDRADLARSLVDHACHWINDRFDLGIQEAHDES